MKSLFLTPPPPPGHLPLLDGLRAIAVTLVLITHFLPLGPHAWGGAAVVGNAGMSLFFGMSGFLVTRLLWESPRAGPFLLRRFARILPLFWLYGAIICLFVTWRPDVLLALLTLTLNYQENLAFPQIAHLWSLCLELHYYLAMALIIGLFGRKGFYLVPVAALVIFLLRLEAGAALSLRTHLRADEILAGSVVCLWWLKRDAPWAKRLEPLLRAALVPATLLWLWGCHASWLPTALLRPWTAAVMLAGLLVLPASAALPRMLAARPLRMIAEISYALYIWHPLFAYGVFDAANKVVKYLVMRPIGLALTLMAACASTFTLERWFMRLARRPLPQKQGRP